MLRSPESISEIPETQQFPELGQCLLALNAPASSWQTVKCDVWLDEHLAESEQIYHATFKFASYIDLVARDTAARFSFERHEGFVKSAASQLSDDADQPTSCELIVRRCWYHAEEVADALTPGFYITVYVFGYGNHEDEADARWRTGLRRVTSVLTELAP